MTTIHTSGRMLDPQTVRLEKAVPEASGEISLVVELNAGKTPDSTEVLIVMEKIWQAQRLRAHHPTPREEVDEYIRTERESWDD